MVLIFHIDTGSYDATSLDGLNVVLAAHTPGPMADGNWSRDSVFYRWPSRSSADLLSRQ